MVSILDFKSNLFSGESETVKRKEIEKEKKSKFFCFDFWYPICFSKPTVWNFFRKPVLFFVKLALAEVLIEFRNLLLSVWQAQCFAPSDFACLCNKIIFFIYYLFTFFFLFPPFSLSFYFLNLNPKRWLRLSLFRLPAAGTPIPAMPMHQIAVWALRALPLLFFLVLRSTLSKKCLEA